VDWPAWMNWERTLLILSLVVNGVLGITLFFKSAIDSILVEWWKEHRSRKGKQHDLLLELNHRVTTLDRSHLQLMLGLGMQHMATTAEDRALATQTLQHAVREYVQTNDFLEKHALDFPRPIRRLVEDLQRTAKLDADAMLHVMPREEILQRSSDVQAASQRVRFAVEEFPTPRHIG